jgi:hypothetical protein
MSMAPASAPSSLSSETRTNNDQEILMKQILIGGLWIFSCASSVLAQQAALPAPSMPYAAAGPQAAPLTVATHKVGGQAECGPSCAVPLKTICVPEVTTKVTVTPMYSKVCEPLCLPKFSLFSGSRNCEGDCAQCERPRNKYYLVVKPCTQERPVVLCKPALVPACASGSGCAQNSSNPALQRVIAELPAAAAMPK